MPIFSGKKPGVCPDGIRVDSLNNLLRISFFAGLQQAQAFDRGGHIQRAEIIQSLEVGLGTCGQQLLHHCVFSG